MSGATLALHLLSPLTPADKWGKKDIESANSKAVERICRFIFNEPKVIGEE